jgi:hypothetical protein
MGKEVAEIQAPSTDPLTPYIYHQTALEFLAGSIAVKGLKENNRTLNVSRVIGFMLLIKIL